METKETISKTISQPVANPPEPDIFRQLPDNGNYTPGEWEMIRTWEAVRASLIRAEQEK